MTILLSIAMIIITFGFVFPQLRDSNSYMMIHYWSDYGSTQGEVILNMLNPLKHFEVIFTKVKMPVIFNLFSVFSFMPVIHWATLLFLVFPGSMILFTSGELTMYNILVYHGFLIIPFMFYSTLINIKFLMNKFISHSKLIMLVIVILIFIVNLGNSRIFKQISENEFRLDPRYDAALQQIGMIPYNSIVSAQVDLASHLAPGENRLIIPRISDKTEYLMFDLEGNPYPLSREDNLRLFNETIESGKWNKLSENKGFVLFKKK